MSRTTTENRVHTFWWRYCYRGVTKITAQYLSYATLVSLCRVNSEDDVFVRLCVYLCTAFQPDHWILPNATYFKMGHGQGHGYGTAFSVHNNYVHYSALPLGGRCDPLNFWVLNANSSKMAKARDHFKAADLKVRLLGVYPGRCSPN